MYTQQIFHNLTTKFLKANLAKANSESHAEGLRSEIPFSKIPKKKLKLAMKLHTFKIFQPRIYSILLTKRGLMTKS